MNHKTLTFCLGFLFIFATSWSQNNDFPYRLSFALDIPLFTTSISTHLLSNQLGKTTEVNYLSDDEILLINPNNVNYIDRSASYNWNPKLDDASDLTVELVNWAPLLLFVPQLKNKQWRNISTIGIMYFEGYYLNNGLKHITKTVTERKRPFLYNNTSLSTEDRLSYAGEGNLHAYRSFYSGHTASAFFSAVFISKVFTDIYGKSNWSYLVWGASLSLAATTGYLRYQSGMHYPSDILVGAVVGSLIGYVIPALHKNRSTHNLSFVASDNYLALSYKF